jgi:hypothetical protein
VTIAKRPSWWARDGRKIARDLPDITSQSACDTLARRANHLVIPEAAQRLSGIHLSRRSVEKWILRCAIAHHSSPFRRPGMTTVRFDSFARLDCFADARNDDPHPFGGISGCTISLNAGNAG